MNTHEFSVCKQSPPPPPYPNDCFWVKQSEYYDSGHIRGQGWEECTENNWCSHCKQGYHKVCDNVESELSDLFQQTVSLDEVAEKNLWDKVRKQIEFHKNHYTNLSQVEKNLESLEEGFDVCKAYRVNQYKHCFRNLQNPYLIEDKRHEQHSNKIRDFKKQSSRLRGKIRSAKKKLSKKQSGKKTKIRSYQKRPENRVTISQLSAPSVAVFKVAKKKSGRK